MSCFIPISSTIIESWFLVPCCVIIDQYFFDLWKEFVAFFWRFFIERYSCQLLGGIEENNIEQMSWKIVHLLPVPPLVSLLVHLCPLLHLTLSSSLSLFHSLPLSLSLTLSLSLSLSLSLFLSPLYLSLSLSIYIYIYISSLSLSLNRVLYLSKL